MLEKSDFMMQLRDYQLEMVSRLERAWTRHRSVLVQMPTGTGKTVLMVEVIRRVGSRVLIVAHRRELIEQIKRTVRAFGIAQDNVVVESIQKLSGGKSETNSSKGDEFSLVIIDEAHHALAKTYRTLWDRWPEAKFLGLTATPCRLSGEAFTDLFDTLLQSWSIKKFVKKGWLSDMEYVSVQSNSVFLQKVAHLNKRGTDGDYQTKEMANVLDTLESIEHLYKTYRKYADGKKGIVYAINRAHAQHIATYYQEQGMNCAVIDSKTPSGVRKEVVEEYRNGELDVLVNVDIFSEGFDVPEVEFIQLARPTLSLSKYLQQLGRGMRVSEGKERVTILDQVGLYLIFGLPTIERDWQRMFLGQQKGKGMPLQMTGNAEWAGGEDKLLVNEEMFRVGEYVEKDGKAIEVRKNRTPQHQSKAKTYGKARLTVFKQRGLYGIKRGDTVSCLPKFEKVIMLKELIKYFALGLLPKGKAGEPERWTVINMEGEDLNTSMAGEFVREEDGVFEFRSNEGGRFVMNLHDVDNDETYTEARLDKMGGLLFIRSFRDDTYTLRGQTTFRKRFHRNEVISNDCLTVIGSDLFVKTDGNRHYQIEGYRGDCVIVRDEQGLSEIKKDGSKRQWVSTGQTTEQPDFQRLGLQRETALSAVASARAERMLRDYQREMLDQFWNTSRRRKRVLLQIPTGTGKTWMAMPVIREEIKMKGFNLRQAEKVLIVTHREELVGQIAETLRRCNIKPRLLETDFLPQWAKSDVTITTTTFIEEHLREVNRSYKPSLIILDEAHLIPANVYDLLYNRWGDAKCLGLTATPMGENGLTLKKVFNQFVASRQMKDLIKEGWLKDIDFVEERIEAIADGEQVYQSYQRHANGRRGIVCAMNEQQAQHIAACYRAHGVEAEVCRDLTTPEGRQQVENLSNGNLKVLVEVRQFSEGFRCPEIEFVQLACPTRSLTTYLHQVGCGMRRSEQDKDEPLIVIDHVGAKEAFGLPTDDRDWSLLFAGTSPGATPPVKKRTRLQPRQSASDRKSSAKATPSGVLLKRVS